MISASDLVSKFQQALNDKWGYIWGKSGQTWTEKMQAAATNEMAIKYGKKWIGKKVADCSGLFAYAFRQLGGSIYHGSNTIWNKYCERQGKITSGMELRPGTAMFLLKNGNRHHIGLYIGNDTVIEAKSTYYGVVTSKVSHWDEWGELKGVDYGDTAAVVLDQEMGTPSLKKGDSGEDVKAVQTKLVALGYSCGKSGVDGIFGKDTLAAVKAFQTDKGLTVDGIVGDETRLSMDISKPETAIPVEPGVKEPTDTEKLTELWNWYKESHKEA